MDWAKGLQNAINYMEDQITETPDYDRIAREMGLSSFYFQRIFSILCGMPPGEYLRCRRLALAGQELLNGEGKVIDLAMKYGYDTPEGFTRAFTRFHGATPSAVRKHRALVRSFSRLSISISVKGGSSMKYRIEQKESFRILAKTQRFEKLEDIRGREDIPRFWSQCRQDGTVEFLLKSAKQDGALSGCMIGLCMEDSTVVKDFPYSIGVEYAGEAVPEGYRLVEVPAAKWAMFKAEEGLSYKDGMQQLFHQIFAEFFPTSHYCPTGNWDIEVYFAKGHEPCEIWIAVQEK